MGIVIRRAEKKDVQIIEELFKEFSGWPIERSVSILTALNDSHGDLLIAEVDNQIAGLIHQVFFVDPFHGGTNSLITDLFVKEGDRSKGIGTELLRQAVKSAEKRMIKEVHVTTREDNDKAIRFYEQHGFRREGILLELNPRVESTQLKANACW